MSLQSVYESLEYESIRPLKKYRKYLKKINRQKDRLRALSDDELKKEWEKFKKAQSKFVPTNFNQTVLVFAFAREVTYRLTGKFQYDVQVLGGLAAIDNNAIQMSTGSGKTLTLILPAVAFGLTHKGTYVLTVNDYLSKRDWEETKAIYDWFNLSNAYVDNDDKRPVQRKKFESDIIYCTNSTLGFAYLYSCLAFDIGDDIKILHRPLYSAIIDECDEVLMDDARNPLIIAKPSSEKVIDTIEYKGQTYSVQEIVDKLKTLHHLNLDHDDNFMQPFLDKKVLKEIQKKLDFSDDMLENPEIMHVIYNSVNAIFNNHEGTDYIVSNTPDPDSGSRIILIDKATGRLAHGRTMNDGMHAFVEMKEGVFSGSSTTSSIQITYQILFNLFETIAGVSGTLGTSYKEFNDIYGLNVLIIPDRLPNKLTQNTRLYTTPQKLNSDLIKLINFYTFSHRPVLVGASSDLKATVISNWLTKNDIDHKLLISTDKNESEIIANAGTPGSVVVTTDIMGRGTDIKPSDIDGERGLVVLQIGIRPNSRVERQFAGRAGRQGQPGHYERLLSLPDLFEMGMEKEKREKIIRAWLDDKNNVEYYQSDILLGGRSLQYKTIVGLIDSTLMATENSESSTRVQDFKAYSIVDLMQVSLIKQLDIIREDLANTVTSHDDKASLSKLINDLANFSSFEPKKNKVHVKQVKNILDNLDNTTLKQKAFIYVQEIVDNVIPQLRIYSEDAQSTTKLAGMVQYQQSPESLMIESLKRFKQNESKYLLFDPTKKVSIKL